MGFFYSASEATAIFVAKSMAYVSMVYLLLASVKLGQIIL